MNAILTLQRRIRLVKYREIIADNLSKAGWSWGCVSAIDSNGRTIFVADAHRGDGKRYVAHDDEKLTTFLELVSAIRAISLQNPNDPRSLYSSSRGDSSAIQCPVFPSNQTLLTI